MRKKICLERCLEKRSIIRREKERNSSSSFFFFQQKLNAKENREKIINNIEENRQSLWFSKRVKKKDTYLLPFFLSCNLLPFGFFFNEDALIK